LSVGNTLSLVRLRSLPRSQNKKPKVQKVEQKESERDLEKTERLEFQLEQELGKDSIEWMDWEWRSDLESQPQLESEQERD